MADDFDFSDLPEVKSQNAAVIEAAGLVPPDPLQESAPLLDEQALADVGMELELEAKYGNDPLTAGLESAAGTATWGATDRLARAIGLTTEEAQKERAHRNPMASAAGSVVGVVGPALLSGGTSLAAKAVGTGAKAAIKAGAAAERATAKLVSKVVAESASKSITKAVLKKSLEKGVGAAVEGGIMGAQMLAREDAIGTADFNAENLLSSVGTGALYGGLVGAALPGLGAAVSGTGSAAKKLFGKALGKYTDPAKAAEQLTGFNASKLAKLESTPAGKQILADLPEWYKNEVKIGLTDDAAQILEKVNLVKKQAADTIESTLNAADEQAKLMLGSPATSVDARFKLLDGVRREIDEKFLVPIKGDKVFRTEARQVQNLLDDLDRYAQKVEPITAKDLVQLKRKMDAIVARAYERAPGAARSRLEKAAFEARQSLNRASQEWVTAVDPQLAAQLKQANRNYQLASTVELPLLRKSVKDPSFVGFRDALYGLGGTAVGGADVGALALGARKLMESDLRRRVVILGGLEQAQAKVASRIADDVKQFLTKGARGARMTSIAALTSSAIAQKREEGKKPAPPKSRKEAYQNAAKNLGTLVAKSDQLLDRGVKAGAVLTHAAPMTAEAVGTKSINAVNFLQSKIPKRPYETIFPSGKQREYDPSGLELARFERYLQIVDNPLSILQELKQGTLTREHVEALRVVYPNLYSRIQQQVLQELEDKDENDVPYAKKVQLGLLLNIPTSDSMLGKNIAHLQANFTRQEQAQVEQQQAAPTKAPNTAQNAASGVQGFLQRRNEPE